MRGGESRNRGAGKATGHRIGRGAHQQRDAAPARSAPAAPPAAASSNASANPDRTRSPRPAPRARRTVKSTRRSSPRAVKRFATFTHATRKTMPTAASRTHSAVATLPTRCSRSGFTIGRCFCMTRTYGAGPPRRCCTRRASGSSFAASCARSVPGAMRATIRGPNPPGVTWAARIVIGTQNATRSSGKRNSGGITPMTVRFWVANV